MNTINTDIIILICFQMQASQKIFVCVCMQNTRPLWKRIIRLHKALSVLGSDSKSYVALLIYGSRASSVSTRCPNSSSLQAHQLTVKAGFQTRGPRFWSLLLLYRVLIYHSKRYIRCIYIYKQKEYKQKCHRKHHHSISMAQSPRGNDTCGVTSFTHLSQ